MHFFRYCFFFFSCLLFSDLNDIVSRFRSRRRWSNKLGANNRPPLRRIVEQQRARVQTHRIPRAGATCGGPLEFVKKKKNAPLNWDALYNIPKPVSRRLRQIDYRKPSIVFYNRVDVVRGGVLSVNRVWNTSIVCIAFKTRLFFFFFEHITTVWHIMWAPVVGSEVAFGYKIEHLKIRHKKCNSPPKYDIGNRTASTPSLCDLWTKSGNRL